MTEERPISQISISPYVGVFSFMGEMRDLLDGSSRRGSLEIVAELLDASCYGVRRTELISKCNLSFSQFKKYLQFALKANLITVEEDEPYVLLKLSHKGKQFLRAYRHLKTLLEQ